MEGAILDLSKCVIDHDTFKKVTYAVINYPHYDLGKLDVSGSFFYLTDTEADDYCHCLVSLIKRKPTLRILNISGNTLGTSKSGLIKLANALANNKTLQALYIHKNKFDLAMAEQFVEIISKNNKGIIDLKLSIDESTKPNKNRVKQLDKQIKKFTEGNKLLYKTLKKSIKQGNLDQVTTSLSVGANMRILKTNRLKDTLLSRAEKKDNQAILDRLKDRERELLMPIPIEDSETESDSTSQSALAKMTIFSAASPKDLDEETIN